MPKNEFEFYKYFNPEEIASLADNELKEHLMFTSAFFLAGVDSLRDSDFPNREINRLMGLFHVLMEADLVPSAITARAPRSMFYLEKRDNEELVMVLIPMDFVARCSLNPAGELSLLVFVASQARDFYNGRFGNLDEVQKRARAYVAEYMLTLKKMDPEFFPGESARKVLVEFPEGLESLPASLRYNSLPAPIITSS